MVILAQTLFLLLLSAALLLGAFAAGWFMGRRARDAPVPPSKAPDEEMAQKLQKEKEELELLKNYTGVVKRG